MAGSSPAMTSKASRRFATGERCGVADGGDVALVVAALEYRRAGDQHIGAGAHDVGGIVLGDAAIDLDVDRPSTDQRAHLRDLVERGRDEGLAAEAGID